MQILELEHQTGLDRSTIRFYEREGFLKPQRKENGYRDYSRLDCENLLKIKLLRQLGMELHTIRALQEGAQEFPAAMDDQIGILQAQILSAQQSRNLCITIRSEVTDYQNLDARHYLDLLGKMQQQGSTEVYPREVPEFSLPVQVHPVRRFVARWLDWVILITLVEMVLYMLLRIRPLADGFLSGVLNLGVRLMAIPIEAAFLHFWGTTPGKWIMGIRLEYYRGGKIPYSSALERSFSVFWSGQGAQVPILSEWLQFRHYCLYTGKRFSRFVSVENQAPEELEWDTGEWEIVYSPWAGKGKGKLAAAAALLILLNGILILDTLKPTYRSNDLTVAQFAENYNDFLTVSEIDEERMNPNGTWEEPPDGTYVIYVGGEPLLKNKPYEFVTEEGFIREIRYENVYKNVIFMGPIPNNCAAAAMVALQSQPGVWYWELEEFGRLLTEAAKQAEGTLRFRNIEVQWSAQAENAVFTSGSFLRENPEESFDVSIDWTIRILKSEP